MGPGIRLGGNYVGNHSSSFLVWAPAMEVVHVRVTHPIDRMYPLEPAGDGYFYGQYDAIVPGARYVYQLDGRVERPDPASRFQPDGVHGPSQIVDSSFRWEDSGWPGIALRDYIIYELHVGTFTERGTFDGITAELSQLVDLGVTAIELMPVAQFPGPRNWGYDGVYPFAVQNSYGGPLALKSLVNACHKVGLAVILDVVYNHLGPEGNYFREFGPYLSDRYRTPWGCALNFDGENSDPVRRFFIENAVYWLKEFHIDALRLDAVHAIFDQSATSFLKQLGGAFHREAEIERRRCYLIAESDLNDPRFVAPEALGGFGLDAQWSDDFHHSLHVLLTGENQGYYSDFTAPWLLAKVFREGYAYTGEHSHYRKRCHGSSPSRVGAKQLVVCSQNHDQIGNRLNGDRLSGSASLEVLKTAAATVALSPFLPLLFMGEEYGEKAPFHYMVSHSDPELVAAVRRGRREEFSGFDWTGEVPDPFAETTSRQCVLNRELSRGTGTHATLYAFYREVIRLRKEVLAIREAEKDSIRVEFRDGVLAVHYLAADGNALLLISFASQMSPAPDPQQSCPWRLLLDSSEACWDGPRSSSPNTALWGADQLRRLELFPMSAVLLKQEGKV